MNTQTPHVTEPIQAPIRHRLYFKVEAVLFRYLLRWNPKAGSRYVCAACLRLDHEHCEGANGRWSFCECDEPDPMAHLHYHPHDPASYWPHPEGVRTEAAEILAILNEDLPSDLQSEAVESLY